MFLEYLALGLLLLVVTGLFYVFMYIHDIPYEIAEKRHHPQKDAIYWGCWLSLFTLHVLWPFIFLWAVSKPAKVELTGGESPDGVLPEDDGKSTADATIASAADIRQMREQMTALSSRIAAIERRGKQASATHD